MAKETRGRVISKKHLARIERERMQRRYILIGSAIVILLVIGFIGYGLLDQSVLQPLQPVASVDGQNISTRNWQAHVRYARQGIVQQYIQTYSFAQAFGSDPSTQQYFANSLQQIAAQLDPTTVGQQELDRMIEDVFIQKEAQKRGITISDDELNKTLQEDFGFYANGTTTPTPETPTSVPPTLSATQLTMVTATPTLTPTVSGTPAITTTPSITTTPGVTATTAAITPTPKATGVITPTPTAAPTLTPTPYTLQMYQDNYKKAMDSLAKNTQISEAEFRQIVKEQLLRKKVEDAITADLSHSQDQVWLRDILVSSEVTATQVTERLNKGEDFGKLANELSQDTATKGSGGDMGWLAKDSLDPAIATVAFQMKVGEISKPIKGQNGYYIVQLIGHEIRQLTSTEYDQQKSQKFSTWLADQRKAANVKTYDYWTQRIPVEPTIPPSILQGQ